MNRSIKAFVVPVVLALLFGIVSLASANTMDEVRLHPKIPLLDEDGQNVLESGRPYSTRQSCGGCHDYESITHAYHMEMGRDEASDDFGKRRGLPQLVSPGYFGGYACMGGSNPETLAKKANASEDDFADLGAADFVQRCEGCHAGGGFMEKDRNGRRYDEVDLASVPALDGDYYSRHANTAVEGEEAGIAAWDWQKSGVVENDCLMCHFNIGSMKVFDPVVGSDDASRSWSDLRRSRLIDQGYFRFANTALLEFANIKHADGAQQDTAVVSFAKEAGAEGEGYSLVLSEAGEPVLNWNAQAFDDNGKVAIPMLRFPNNDSCMSCHRTSNSRRGFYGFGEGAQATYAEEDGTLIEDYQDDVHKGKIWTEPNGETRAIENCNACHSRNYYKPAYANVDLHANHNFLKGNSDMDVRNDLDYSPNAKSCEYCHNDAPDPAIPSGHETLLEAHLERWKASGDMAGYPQSTLTRITQTHMDVVSCQTCHINGKEYKGSPLLPLYRYRRAENGKLTIVPYNPRLRYYWKDKNSGRVMTKTERDSVFELREGDGGEMYGAIIDPASGTEVGSVPAHMSHGSWRFDDPEDYDTFMALKQAFDEVLRLKGVEEPDAVMVWTESNHYLMSHNTRPAVASVQCEQCHSRKQDGSFSSLVSATGLLGEANVKTVTTLPDPRLVEEGVVVLDLPYMKIDEAGVVSENVADILYASKIDPSMTILKAATATVVSGELKRLSIDEGLARAGFDQATQEALADLFGSGELYLFTPAYGDPELAGVALMPEANPVTELTFPSYKMEVAIAAEAVADSAARQGQLQSPVYLLQARDSSGAEVENFSGGRVLVKLPYRGSAEGVEVDVIYSRDAGQSWQPVAAEDVVALVGASAESDGYVAFWVDHFSDYAVVERGTRATTPTPDLGTATVASSGGGGSQWLLGLISLLCLVGRGARRRTAS